VQEPLWQVSAPLQMLPSGHAVPLSTGALLQPVTALQVSFVQTFESLQLSAVPPVQEPLWQVSSPLQTLLSVHVEPFGRGVLAQPVSALQLSVVQTLLSLQLSGEPAVQVPAWQVSSPLQTVPSAHGLPLATGFVKHPMIGSQLSVVQTLPSLQPSTVPAVQAPLWQVSPPLQRLPSGQGVPLLTGDAVQPKAASQLSAVHALPSLQSSGEPAPHTPLWQLSSPLHTLPSSQEVPFRTGAFAQPEAGPQLSVVQRLPSSQSRAAPAVQAPL
jgi:hypothetical protein